jgi:DNA-binding Lrp family transcriptional regulator
MDELLKLLKENALETPENMARMLNTSVEDITTRRKAFEEEGIIRGYQAIVDEDKLDLDKVTAVIEVKITPEREGGFDRIAQRICRFEAVRSAYLMSGAYDLLLFVAGRNLREVASFVSEKLSTMDSVTSTGTHFMLKTYKNDGVMMEMEEEDERLKVTP